MIGTLSEKGFLRKAALEGKDILEKGLTLCTARCLRKDFLRKAAFLEKSAGGFS